MKRILSLAIIVASLSVPVFAAKNSQTITLTESVKVGSTQLPAGSYKVTWLGTGANVQLQIAVKGQAPVAVAAKMVDAKNGHVSVVTDTVGGMKVLESIQLDNCNLVLASGSASGE